MSNWTLPRASLMSQREGLTSRVSTQIVALVTQLNWIRWWTVLSTSIFLVAAGVVFVPPATARAQASRVIVDPVDTTIAARYDLRRVTLDSNRSRLRVTTRLRTVKRSNVTLTVRFKDGRGAPHRVRVWWAQGTKHHSVQVKINVGDPWRTYPCLGLRQTWRPESKSIVVAVPVAVASCGGGAYDRFHVTTGPAKSATVYDRVSSRRALPPVPSRSFAQNGRPAHKTVSWPGDGLQVRLTNNGLTRLGRTTKPLFTAFVRHRLTRMWNYLDKAKRCKSAPLVVVKRWRSDGFAAITNEGTFAPCPTGGAEFIYVRVDGHWRAPLVAQEGLFLCQRLRHFDVPRGIAGHYCYDLHGNIVPYAG